MPVALGYWVAKFGENPQDFERWHQLAFESSALSLPGVVRGGCTQLGTLGTCVVSTE